MASRPAPDYRLSDALGTDLLDVFQDLPDQDRGAWDRARGFTAEVLPRIDELWETAQYPVDLVQRLGDLDLLTDGVDVPGRQRLSALAAGLVTMEISRGDGSIGAAAAVQGGLVLRSLSLFASPQQQERLLEPVASGRLLGGFALTEPRHGSDAVSLETTARREGDTWILDGHKKWIGNGASGGFTLVWARDVATGGIRGFIVEQSSPGYTAEVITGKGALRAIHQAEITLEGVRVSEQQRLPGVESFQDVSRALVETRVSVGWSALGHATAMFEAALAYSTQREQFGKPLAAHQMIQERLTRMLESLTNMQLQCRAAAALQEAGRLRPAQASMIKYHGTRAARRIGAISRDMLGGNGILLENQVIRHLGDVEALHTYEGTESVQALILGREITGVSAFD